MLAPRLRGAGRLAVLLLGAAALQWDLGYIAFLSPAPRQPALRTALRSVEVEAEAETDVSVFDTLTVGRETNKAKLAGAIRKQLDQRDAVTVRYAGQKGMHIAVNAVARANQYFTSNRQEAGETPFCRLIVSPKYETIASKEDPDQEFVVMDLTVRELQGPLASQLHAEEQGDDSTLDAFRVSKRTEVPKLAGAVKARLEEKGSLRLESWGSEALKSSLTALTQVSGMSENEGGPGIWFHPFFQEVNRSGDGEGSTMHVVVMDVLQVPDEGA